MDSSKPTRRPNCFIDEDDGLASLADMEPGFSGNLNAGHHHHHHHHWFFSRPIYNRRASFRSISSGSFSRSARFFEDPQPHFLDSCFLCRKPLADNSDIFMYRGDTPFCSEECRQEQIEIDEAKEKKWNRSSASSMKAMRRKDKRKSTSPNRASSPQDYPFHVGTIAAA